MQTELGAKREPRGWIDRNAIRQTCSWGVLSRSLLVALVIGTLLNIINQGPELVAGKPPDWLKLLLTYAVPFFVASYGAYSAFRQLDVRKRSPQVHVKSTG